MEVSNLIYFLSASMLLTIAPGPDILYVVTQSIAQGKRAGIVTALGLCTGLVAHTAAAAFGVSVILQQSAAAFRILKYAGAIYLFYLAWKALREGRQPVADGTAQKKGMAALYRQGIFMNILNPKVGLFFLAFLPQFVNPEAGDTTGQMVLLGFLFMLQAICIFSAVSALAGVLGKIILNRPGTAKYMNYAKAGVFALIGLRLALAER